jgi:cyclopropane fatty-acyl-phospholipid synthase-like methyltransferase
MDNFSPSKFYNRDYFENGIVNGISGYMNYRWMPELTLRMVHYLAENLPLQRDQKILDFGCAKGFVVKALKILDFDAYGVDISEYATKNADGDIRDYCRLVTGVRDRQLYDQHYDWLLSKDVFEHIVEEELEFLLKKSVPYVDRMFAVIPVAANDYSNEFIVPDYNRDITHVTIKSKEWWQDLFQSTGWTVEKMASEFPGCKESWTSRWRDGNVFFTLSAAGQK